MEQYHEQMRLMLQMAETGRESLEHLASRIEEKQENVPLYLLIDLIDLLLSIQDAYGKFTIKPDQCQMEEELISLSKELGEFIPLISKGDVEVIGYLIRTNLIPTYSRWQNSMISCFHPYILC